MTIHEDNRRILQEIISDEIMKSLKLLEAKDDCVVGNHYHASKDENFFLISGEGTITLGGDEEKMELRRLYKIPRGTFHSFKLQKGSLLLGTASEPYDPHDEYTS